MMETKIGDDFRVEPADWATDYEALRAVRDTPGPVAVYTDSTYVIRGIPWSQLNVIRPARS